MKNSKYSRKILEDIYNEGDRDIIFFGQIIGAVSYDENDRPLGKSPDKRFSDGMVLVEYLISAGDFFPGETKKVGGGKVVNDVSAGGFWQFSKIANEFFSRGGINDVDLNSGIWLKKTRAGKLPPSVPLKIDALFS